MGTNSYIGIIRDNGSVDYIWVKFDGQPESTGFILHYDFKEIENIEYLISRGNLRSLGNRHYQWRAQNEIIANQKNIENGCKIDTSKYGPYKMESKAALICKAKDDFCDYVYVYEDEKWMVWRVNTSNPKWYPLGEFMEWHMGRTCCFCGKIEAEHHKFESDEEERFFSEWVGK